MSRESDANDSTVDRRSVLRAVGASALGGIALSGSAAAGRRSLPEDLRERKAEFEDPATVRATVAEQADALLGELARRGVLTSASAAEFPTEDLLTPGEYSEADEATTVRGAFGDGEWKVEVATRTETAAHAVELVVKPDRGRSYAVVDPKGDGAYRLTSDENDDVSVNDHCHYESQCLSYYQCDSGSSCQRQERHCCDDNGDGDEDSCTDWYNDGCCDTTLCG